MRRDAIVIDFSGKRATYSKEQLQEIELAYAITVHKSQGSEFDCVILPILDTPSKLLYRNLLYTAVTRARDLLVTVGSAQTIDAMTQNDRKAKRYSALKHFLKAGF